MGQLSSLFILAATATALIYGAEPGPVVGTTIPSFTLSDQNGAKQTLSSIRGHKGAMLVFFRSADW